MQPMTVPPTRTTTTILTASIASLLAGVVLTLGITLGTHGFERVRTIQVLADIPTGYQLPRIDEENYYRQLSGVLPVTTTGYDLPRADEETFYQQPQVVPSVINRDSDLPRPDEETYYRVADWNGPPSFEQARRSDPQ